LIDAVVLNRNLGQACDNLCDHVERVFGSGTNIVVVDCSTSSKLASNRPTVTVGTLEALRDGLRFNRGMNLGIGQVVMQDTQNEWILLLPVDTEIVDINLEGLKQDLISIPEIVGMKPLSEESAYGEHSNTSSPLLGWNFEEGPWLLKKEFVKSQMEISDRNEFFDNANFRGYMTSLEISFRAYANGNCVGITKNLVLRENETYLLEKSELIKTEPVDENRNLYISEGVHWLKAKYGLEDPWDFAQLVRLSFDRFLVERPEYRHMSIFGEDKV
jgi:hypothetical protein